VRLILGVPTFRCCILKDVVMGCTSNSDERKFLILQSSGFKNLIAVISFYTCKFEAAAMDKIHTVYIVNYFILL
jgi:hypothetical protein